jgi:allantoinase
MSERIIRGGRVLTAAGMIDCDVLIADGRIADVGSGLCVAPNVEEIDATGMLVLPGVVDAHVHFNEPGREHWEGFATGSRALAAGGATTFVDMPLNANPPAIDRESFLCKRAAGEASSVLDFALWGGLIPSNLDRLEELAECGAVGFKAFMIDSGVEDFPSVGEETLRRGMKIAARLGLPVAVHAEDAGRIEAATREMRAAGRSDARAWLDSRPPESEIEAVRRVLDLAGETGCSLHVVHVSCPEAVDLVIQARSRGLDVTCEACPHHLLWNETVAIELGALAKCAPPLRDEVRRTGLWKALIEGGIDSIGSDHSPAPPDMKMGFDVFSAWGGIMGCQHGFLLMLDAILSKNPENLPLVWERMSARPARRMGIASYKGSIAIGHDADVVLVSNGPERVIEPSELLYRHRISPYIGTKIRSRVARSLLRGEDIGRTSGAGGGRFIPRKAV